MKKTAIGCGILVILGIIALMILGVFGGAYNRLVKLQQAVDSQWAQVQNVYQRRNDLIPNLVSTVSGAANFEKSTLTDITQARTSVGQVKIDPSKAPTDPAQMAQFEQAQNGLGSALLVIPAVSVLMFFVNLAFRPLLPRSPVAANG